MSNQRIYNLTQFEKAYLQDCLDQYRSSTNMVSDNVKITSSTTAAEAFEYLKNRPVEVFAVMFLNRDNRIIALEEMFKGGRSMTIIDPARVMKRALELNASGMIVSHNHPSGNLKPSPADIDITKRLVEGGKFLSINVLDHIIISNRGHYSFADEGAMPM